MSGADLNGFTSQQILLDTIKDAMKEEILSPGWWDSKRKNKLRGYCPHNSDLAHPHSAGNPKFKLKVWLEQGELIARCDDCGVIPNFAELIGLKDVRTPTAIIEPSATTPECPTSHQNGDSSHDLGKPGIALPGFLRQEPAVLLLKIVNCFL